MSRVAMHIAFCVGHAQRIHVGQEGAVRCGLGDAATLCSILANEALTDKSIGPPAARRAASSQLKAAADAIWGMRDKIEVTP